MVVIQLIPEECDQGVQSLEFILYLKKYLKRYVIRRGETTEFRYMDNESLKRRVINFMDDPKACHYFDLCSIEGIEGSNIKSIEKKYPQKLLCSTQPTLKQLKFINIQLFVQQLYECNQDEQKRQFYIALWDLLVMKYTFDNVPLFIDHDFPGNYAFNMQNNENLLACLNKFGFTCPTDQVEFNCFLLTFYEPLFLWHHDKFLKGVDIPKLCKSNKELEDSIIRAYQFTVSQPQQEFRQYKQLQKLKTPHTSFFSNFSKEDFDQARMLAEQFKVQQAAQLNEQLKNYEQLKWPIQPITVEKCAEFEDKFELLSPSEFSAHNLISFVPEFKGRDAGEVMDQFYAMMAHNYKDLLYQQDTGKPLDTMTFYCALVETFRRVDSGNLDYDILHVYMRAFTKLRHKLLMFNLMQRPRFVIYELSLWKLPQLQRAVYLELSVHGVKAELKGFREILQNPTFLEQELYDCKELQDFKELIFSISLESMFM